MTAKPGTERASSKGPGNRAKFGASATNFGAALKKQEEIPMETFDINIGNKE